MSIIGAILLVLGLMILSGGKAMLYKYFSYNIALKSIIFRWQLEKTNDVVKVAEEVEKITEEEICRVGYSPDLAFLSVCVGYALIVLVILSFLLPPWHSMT